MESGTVVALVLGVVGFVVSGITLWLNRSDAMARTREQRSDDRERRWLQEKRLIYVRSQNALQDVLYALLDFASHDHSGPGIENSRSAPLDSAWERLWEVRGDVDVLAPESVRQAISHASDALGEMDDTLRATLHFPGEERAVIDFAGQEVACRMALDAMREDLGVEPLPRSAPGLPLVRRLTRVRVRNFPSE